MSHRPHLVKTIPSPCSTRTLFTHQKLALLIKVVLKAGVALTPQPSNGRNYSYSTGNHSGEIRGMDLVTQAHDARTLSLVHANMLPICAKMFVMLFAHTDIHTQN